MQNIKKYFVKHETTLPVIIWLGIKEKELRQEQKKQAPETADRNESLFAIIKEGFSSPTYRRVFLAFSTCGFNMSIIESHLFSQFVLWGISETAASMIMTIYGIMTMLGAIGTGLLGISGDSTVPPTTGLITREFGSEKLTILYGFAMMAHQVGALASASFGGNRR